MKIVIWTGPAWETWGPQSLKTGIGGSETAAIHMSAELARWGHEVSVIGQVTPCEWEGVRFCDYRLFGPGTIGCDVFVASRYLDTIHKLKPDAKLTALWCHDIHVGDDYQGLMRQYDMVLCLSTWSRKVLSTYYNDVPRDKFILTRNGIDTRLFLREPKKTRCKAIYSSSPDRGLDHLLNYWPRIRKYDQMLSCMSTTASTPGRPWPPRGRTRGRKPRLTSSRRGWDSSPIRASCRTAGWDRPN